MLSCLSNSLSISKSGSSDSSSASTSLSLLDSFSPPPHDGTRDYLSSIVQYRVCTTLWKRNNRNAGSGEGEHQHPLPWFNLVQTDATSRALIGTCCMHDSSTGSKCTLLCCGAVQDDEAYGVCYFTLWREKGHKSTSNTCIQEPLRRAAAALREIICLRPSKFIGSNRPSIEVLR